MTIQVYVLKQSNIEILALICELANFPTQFAFSAPVGDDPIGSEPTCLVREN